VLDPTSYHFSDNQLFINEYTPYRVDSIAFPYRYYRYQHDAPDTLVIQYLNQSKFHFYPLTELNTSYAQVAYNRFIDRAPNPTYEFTYLLTDADTANSLGYLKFPVGIDIPAGGKFATTVTYFPGNPYSFGDTLGPYTAPNSHNKINDFTVFEFQESEYFVDSGDYNHSIDATTTVRYNINPNGWNGSYVPGTAWYAGVYHMDINFLLTYPNPTGLLEPSSDLKAIIFPNPAEDILKILLPKGLKQSRFEVYNTLGSLVLSGDLKSENETIAINGFSPGLYSVRIFFSDGKIAERKFIKL